MKEKEEEWTVNSPTFEFTNDLPPKSSAWSGHYFFAYDLVANTKPKIIVELGTHKGNSLFSFAQAIKDLKLETELHGVDTWEGDKHTGFYGEEVYKKFLDIKDKYYKEVNIVPHKMYFDDALDEFEDNSIDILHIDGLHTYDAVKHDFENWLPKVNKDSGIILFHDVCEKSDDFGVYKLWNELKTKYNSITFEHYHGLGVITFDNLLPLKKSIKDIFPLLYKRIAELNLKIDKEQREKQKLQESHRNSDIDIKNLGNVKNSLENSLEEIAEINKKLIKENNEFRAFKKGLFWRFLTKYRLIREKLHNLINKKY